MFKVTRWTKHITDSGEDIAVCEKPKELNHKFRLLDDDNLVYAYGYSSSCDDDEAFEPLDYYSDSYGVTEIQYKNKETGEWETL